MLDVLGVLLDDQRKGVAVTVEPAWRENERGLSCIPLGVYECVRVLSPKHGDTFEVDGVPGRDQILFHAGNTSADSQGCIILGSMLGEQRADGRRVVIGSRLARDRFWRKFGAFDRFWLEVTRLPDVGEAIDAQLRRMG